MKLFREILGSFYIGYRFQLKREIVME